MSKVATLLAVVFLPALASAQIPMAPTPGAPVQPPPRDAQQAQTGTATIRGRVFAADTGAPLRKAQVRIFAPALREQHMTSTDAQGRYEFKELPAGRYGVSASKGSYVTLSYGQERPFEPGRQLELADGQTLEKVDFSLPRGGVITGHIVDEYGDPVADAQVSAMRYAFQQGRRQLVPAGRFAQTNDIGEFRLFGLPPGQYYISATLRNFGPMGTSDDRSGYAPTYYPGTPSVGEAQKVTVNVGQALTGINLALIVSRTARVSGTVIDSDGKPATGGFVMIGQRTGAMMMMGAGAQIHPDGTFTATNVAPGDYILQANVGGGFGDVGQFATTKITVTGDDIDGVRLTAMRPAIATGKVVLNGAMANTTVRGSTFRLLAQPANPEDMGFGGGGGGGQPKDDLTFELRIRPCVCVLRMIGPQSDWFLKTVRLNGTDVTDTGIDFRPDQEVSGLEVELTNQPTSLSGIVTDAKGQPSHEYTFILFARDSERWNAGSRYISIARPDQDGRYKLRGVAAGEYYAVAVDYVEQGEWTDPEYLDRIKAGATSLTLSDGETKSLDLRLTPSS